MDKKKNIVLCGIIVLAFGGAAYFWMGSDDSAPLSRPPNSTTVTTSGSPSDDLGDGADAVSRGSAGDLDEDFDRPTVDQGEEDAADQVVAERERDRAGQKKAKRRRRPDRDEDEVEEETEQDNTRILKPVNSIPG